MYIYVSLHKVTYNLPNISILVIGNLRKFTDAQIKPESGKVSSIKKIINYEMLVPHV